MAALRTSQAPLMIRLPDGRLVPVSGGALVDNPTPAPAAAMMDDTGALSQHGIRAAGDSGAVAPEAALAQVINMAQRRAGAAAAPGVPIPRQPDVMTEQQGGSSSFDLASLVKAIGKAAGKTGSGAGVHETPLSMPGIDPTDSAFKVPSLSEGALKDTIPDGTAPPTSASGASGPGFLDRMKSFLGIGDSASSPVVPIAAAPQSGIPAGAPTYTDRHPGLQVDPGTGEVASAAAPAGALPQTAAAPERPGFFDRLRANPMALALLTGGLGTMAAASRPGATPLGAIGEGALGGIRTAFEEDASQKEEARKQLRETSEAKLRDAQGVFYGDRGQVLHEKADTDAALAPAKIEHLGALTAATGQRGAAAGVNANANMIRANASAKNADTNRIKAQKAAAGTVNPTSTMRNVEWMVRKGIAKDENEAFNKLKSAAKNRGQRASLVTARAKLYLQSSIAPTEADVATAKKNAERDVDADLRDAAPAKGGGGALDDAAHPQSKADLDQLSSGALYVNPADGKTYRKK